MSFSQTLIAPLDLQRLSAPFTASGETQSSQPPVRLQKQQSQVDIEVLGTSSLPPAIGHLITMSMLNAAGTMFLPSSTTTTHRGKNSRLGLPIEANGQAMNSNANTANSWAPRTNRSADDVASDGARIVSAAGSPTTLAYAPASRFT